MVDDNERKLGSRSDWKMEFFGVFFRLNQQLVSFITESSVARTFNRVDEDHKFVEHRFDSQLILTFYLKLQMQQLLDLTNIPRLDSQKFSKYILQKRIANNSRVIIFNAESLISFIDYTLHFLHPFSNTLSLSVVDDQVC